MKRLLVENDSPEPGPIHWLPLDLLLTIFLSTLRRPGRLASLVECATLARCRVNHALDAVISLALAEVSQLGRWVLRALTVPAFAQFRGLVAIDARWPGEASQWNYTLPSLAHCSRLRHLKLRAGDTMRELRALTALQSLKAGGSVSDNDLAPLIALTRLSLYGNRCVTGAALTGLTGLTALSLSYCPLVGGEVLLAMPALRSLVLCEPTRFTNDLLTRLTQLTRLKLRDNRSVDERAFAVLTRLTDLDVGITPLSDATLARLTALQRLKLAWCATVSDAGLRPLTALRDLDIGCNELISDDGVSQLHNLTTLNARTCAQFTGAALAHLCNLTSLRIDGHTRLPTPRCCPNLRKISTGHCLSLGVLAASLVDFTALRKVVVMYPSSVDILSRQFRALGRNISVSTSFWDDSDSDSED
jgi:hypothetical protein